MVLNWWYYFGFVHSYFWNATFSRDIKYYKDKIDKVAIMLLPILAIWGCVPELTKDCVDMTNASSTYLGIVIGAVIGAIISWWIYNRQTKTSRQQDDILQHINNLEEKNTRILKKLERFAKHHEEVLNKIFLLNENMLALDRKVQSMTEEQK